MQRKLTPLLILIWSFGANPAVSQTTDAVTRNVTAPIHEIGKRGATSKKRVTKVPNEPYWPFRMARIGHE